MKYIKAFDETALYYKDWGAGNPIVFVHGWAVSSDSWEYLMTHLSNSGYRCIAYDQRGCGRSEQAWEGYGYSALADDLAAVLRQLNLRKVVLIGHSMGCGIISRYLTEYGDASVSKAVFLSTTTPFLELIFDTVFGNEALHRQELIKQKALKDRPAYIRALTDGFFGLSEKDCTVSRDMVEWGMQVTMQSSMRATLKMIDTYTHEDQRGELEKIKLPVLLLHGDKDVSAVPEFTAVPTSKLLPNCELKILKNHAHGSYVSHAHEIAPEIIKFMKG